MMDENVAPAGMRTRSATQKERVAKLKQIKERTKPTGPKRAVLGDVTNKQGLSNSKAGNNSSLAMKKRPTLEEKPRGAKRTLEIPFDDINSSAKKNNQGKCSPMCISTDLQSMTLDHSKFDIDSADKKNGLSCWQYAEDVYKYYFSLENERRVDEQYMHEQSDINSKMRAILIDWMLDVHSKWKLLPQTLHITVNLLDRYLESDSDVQRHKLQLVGITAMFLASKFEEIYPPEPLDFVQITDNAYTIDEVFEKEEEMLKALGFKIVTPSAWNFLKRFLKASGATSERQQHFAHYIIDRSLQEYKLLKYKPSMIAASALHISRSHFHQHPLWPAAVEYHSTYSESDISECVQDLKEMLWSAKSGVGKSSNLTAANRKFAKPRYLGVSMDNFQFDEF